LGGVNFLVSILVVFLATKFSIVPIFAKILSLFFVAISGFIFGRNWVFKKSDARYF
jgi:putative flippase GtrA